LVHKGNLIEAVSILTLKNEKAVPVNKLIMSLNEGLEITSLKLNGQAVPFSRQHHLLIADEKVSIEQGQQAEVEIAYAGTINEDLCYLDIPEEERQLKYGKFVLNVDKRYAFLTPDYVLLTPETNWYPKTGVTYSSADVRWYLPEFIDFNLEVTTAPELQAISQGNMTLEEPGKFRFESRNPLTQMSLAIGNYEKKNVERDSIEFGIWVIKGHDYFSSSFPEAADTIPQIIGERLGDFERTYKLEYAFDRLFLVEVPAQFKSYERIWTSRQENVQPEQVFIPEKAFMHREADLEGSKKRMDQWGRRADFTMTDKDKEIRLVFDFLSLLTNERTRNFIGEGGGWNQNELVNPYFIFPMLYNFQNNIQSETWPITNRIFEAYLKSQTTDMRALFMQDTQGLSGDEMANIALQDSTFEEILSDPKQKSIVGNVIKLKGEVLFSIVQWTAGQEEFQRFLGELLRQYRFKNISFEDFDKNLHERFEIELIPLMDNWFKAKSLPGYLFSPIKAVKVKSGERMRTKVTVKVTNFSETEGIVKFSFRLGGGGGPGRGFGRGPGAEDVINKLVYLEPQQTKDLSFMIDGDPRMVTVNTMTSKNIPQVIMQGFRDIEEDPKGIPFEGEVVSNIPVSKQLPGEIIIDNEDPQFIMTVSDEVSLLEKWLHSETEGTQKYSGTNYWRPPVNWTAVTNSDFFGEYVRSAYYIKSGDGSMKAEWHVPVSEPGYYDVYYHLYKPRRFGRGGGGGNNEEKGEYQFFIHSDEGAEEQTLAIQSAEDGWNHLGSFFFSPDTALIELSNKSESRVIFADAVRLVKL
jgi:hypothetical protein